MIKKEIKIIFFRFLIAILFVSILGCFLDFKEIKPDFIAIISVFLTILDVIICRIDEAHKFFHEQQIIDYELELELNKVLRNRNNYFKFYLKVSIFTLLIAFVLSIFIMYCQNIKMYLDYFYYICFTLLLFNFFTINSFINAYFDCKEAITELKIDFRENERYSTSDSGEKSELPELPNT